MPYCGQFGCGCCSRECDQCGKMHWKEDLEDGLCYECRTRKDLDDFENLKNLCRDFFEDQNYINIDSIKQRDLGNKTNEFLITLGKSLGIIKE